MRAYRCITTTQLNIGGFDPPESIQPQEVIMWDGGAKLQREGGESLVLKNSGGFKALVNAGWVVPDESSQTVAIPKAAGVRMHEASPRGVNRAQVDYTHVDDDERDVGDVGSVRRAANKGAVPPTHQSKNAGERQRQRVVVEGQTGVVVGRLKNPAEAPPIELGSGLDKSIVSRLSDTKSIDPVAMERFPTKRAASREFSESDVKATVHQTSSSFSDQYSGEIVGRVGKPIRKELRIAEGLPEDPIEALRVWSEYGTAPDGETTYSPRQVMALVKTLLATFDGLLTGEPEDEEEPAEETKVAWDLEAPWRDRCAALARYRNAAPELRYILSVETSPAVTRLIEEYLETLEG